MSVPRVVRAGALVGKPWRNGQGTTRDILSGPGGETDWLVSLADLERDAPFSAFAEAERTFTIVAGAGVLLDFAAGAVECPPLVPIVFPGEAAPRCRLVGGPAKAFNVIVGRGRYAASVAVLRLAPGHRAALPAGTTALHCVAGTLGASGERLEAGDTVVGAVDLVEAREAATAIRVAIRAV